MYQTIITEYFTNFYDKNKNDKYCFNSHDLKNRIKKCEDKRFYIFSEKIDKEVGFINILLGIGGQLIFTKDNFYILEELGMFSVNILKYSFVDFKFINGKPKTGRNIFFTKEHEIGFLNFKEKRVSHLFFRNNDFFDLISQIQRELPDVIQKQLEEDNRVQEIKRIKQEEHDLVEKNKILEKRRIIEEKERKQREIQIQNEKIRKEKLESSKSFQISKLDQDNNGEIDLIDCDSFTKLLNTKQKNIIEIDKNYIQKFVKISIYIKKKKSNIQKLFQTIKSVKYENELEELVGLLQNQVHTYNLLVFHSINMITSLTESELITFYEIYECFDKLGVFNSNWENEVSTDLLKINNSIDEVNQSVINLDDNISSGLQNLMYSINDMENNIINSINELTYTNEDSFKDLNQTIESQLSDINSSVNFNNLLTGIQTYQVYKINQNTKRIR